MQWRTIIFDPENWALGENASKDVMLWAIKDMPWLHVRTFGNLNITRFPTQFKSNSWTSVEINEQSKPSNDINELSVKIRKRMAVLQDLNYRLDVAQQNLGISNSNFNILDFYKFLTAKNIIEGTYSSDSIINFENKIQILSHLDLIKQTVIDQVLAVDTDEGFQEVKTQMERLFFTNILL
jgi:hypothetical protein